MNVACAVAVLCLGIAGVTASGQTPQGSADTSKTRRVADTTRAVPLPQVTIQGRRVSVPPRFEDAYRRAASGRGYYFTREEIEQTNPRDIMSLLQRVPSVQVDDRGLTFARCQGNLPSRDEPAPPARVQVFIDNPRATSSDAESVKEVLQSISVQSIQLMEVYTGVSRIPGEFLSDACAAIIIWTKSY